MNAVDSIRLTERVRGTVRAQKNARPYEHETA